MDNVLYASNVFYAEVGFTLRQELWVLPNHVPPSPVLSVIPGVLPLDFVPFFHWLHAQFFLPWLLSSRRAAPLPRCTRCPHLLWNIGGDRLSVGQSSGLRGICPSLVCSAFPIPRDFCCGSCGALSSSLCFAAMTPQGAPGLHGGSGSSDSVLSNSVIKTTFHQAN